MEKQTVGLKAKIVVRNDTSSNWTTTNPVLLKGEFGYCTDMNLLKVGDGLTTWNNLKKLESDNQFVCGDGIPSMEEAEIYGLGTIWMNRNGNPVEIYILTNQGANGRYWRRLIHEDCAEIITMMKSTDFAKTAGAGKDTGYVDKALIANKLTTTRSIALSGDIVGSASFDGSANISIAATLKNSGATAGTYSKVTVDAKGVVIKGEALAVTDIPTIPSTKVSGLGTAATKNVGIAAGNVPELGANGKLADSVIPSLAIGDTFEAATEAAMLALSAAQKGDVCIRSDISKTFILAADTPNLLVSWKELKTPTSEVISVNGQKGAVVLTSSNIAEGTNQYYTQARFDTALTAKSTTNLKEGTNLYYTDARVKAFIENANNVFVLDGGNATGN